MAYSDVTAALLEQVSHAIHAAFTTPAALDRLTTFHLKTDFGDIRVIATGDGMPALALAVAKYADLNGMMRQLIEGALKLAPNNPAVKKLHKEYFSSAQPTVTKDALERIV